MFYAAWKSVPSRYIYNFTEIKISSSLLELTLTAQNFFSYQTKFQYLSMLSRSTVTGIHQTLSSQSYNLCYVNSEQTASFYICNTISSIYAEFLFVFIKIRGDASCAVCHQETPQGNACYFWVSRAFTMYLRTSSHEFD